MSAHVHVIFFCTCRPLVRHRVAANGVGRKKMVSCRAVGWARSLASYAHTFSLATIPNADMQRIVRLHASPPWTPCAFVFCTLSIADSLCDALRNLFVPRSTAQLVHMHFNRNCPRLVFPTSRLAQLRPFGSLAMFAVYGAVHKRRIRRIFAEETAELFYQRVVRRNVLTVKSG